MAGLFRVFCILFILGTGRAVAGQCPTADDLAQAGSYPGAALLNCVELASFSIPTGRGPIAGVIYGNPDANRFLVAQMQAALITSGAALQSIGPFGSEPVEVYISPTEYVPSPDGENAAAATLPSLDIGPGNPETCIIAVFSGVYSWPVNYLTAHEFFHCVQWNEFFDQMEADRAGWWYESSADWFASIVFQGGGALDRWVAEFDANSSEEPLTRMTYANVVFFWWLSQSFGPLRVMDLIGNMPVGAASQDDALAATLSEDEFLAFVQDYLDQKIRQPGGRVIPSVPTVDVIFNTRRGGELTITAPRFVTYRAGLRFACGEWSTRVVELQGRYGAQRDGQTAWGALPERVVPLAGDDTTYLIAGAATAPDGFSLTIEAEKDDCSRCVVPDFSTGPEACLVGDWHLTSGGMGAKIGEMLADVPELQGIDFPDLDGFLTLNADGTFTIRADDSGSMQVVSDAGEVFGSEMQINMQQQGTWSVRRDRLEQCYSANRQVNIEDRIIDPNGTAQVFSANEFLGARPSYTTKRRFTCVEGRLEITERALFAPTINWVYEQ